MSDPKKRWQEVKGVLDAVLDQKPAARVKFLERVCAHDADLLEEVRTLLEQHDDDAFLERPLMDRPAPAAVDSPPERVRSYRFMENIGSGGMGIVYRVVDDTGKSFALKRIPSRQVSDETLRRFRRESKTAAKLRHPNIVHIVSFGEQDGDPFLLMECLIGETLRDLLLREKHASIELTLDVARQAAAGLDYAHTHGIVHRDLKPSNLFRSEDGSLKILDFGIAKPLGIGEDAERSGLSRLTKTGEVLGSPNYMAPEQARAEPVDARADLFSLGSILYEMLAGHIAVEGDSLAARINSLLVDEPHPLSESRPDLSSDLVALVHRCLTKEPSGRPASAQSFLSELSRCER